MPFRYPSLFARLMANSKESTQYSFEGRPCWEWTARVDRYPRVRIYEDGKSVTKLAHRVMAELVLRRQLCPDDETVEHRCGLPWCINYWHFALCSRVINSADARARKLGRPVRLFPPLVDPGVFYSDDLERSLPRPRSEMLEECPF